MAYYRNDGNAPRQDGYKRDSYKKEWYKEEDEKPEWEYDDDEEDCRECEEKREHKKESKKPICTVVCPFKIEVKIVPCDDCHKKCEDKRRPM